jgi:hypothetical protein
MKKFARNPCAETDIIFRALFFGKRNMSLYQIRPGKKSYDILSIPKYAFCARHLHYELYQYLLALS